MKRFFKIVNIESSDIVALKNKISENLMKDSHFLLYRINVFFKSENESDFIEKSEDLYKIIQRHLKNQNILISIVPQTPIDVDDLLIEFEYLNSEDDISINTFFASNSILQIQEVDSKNYQEINISFNPLKYEHLSALSLFETLELLIKYSVKSNEMQIIRIWNFICNITGISFDNNHEIQNYQQFNNARFELYKKFEISLYPASTGIGMDWMKILTILTAVPNKNSQYIHLLSNKFQIDAFKYSPKVLVGEKEQKYPPLFSRGLLFDDGENIQIFVSGTSSISGEESIDSNNIEGALNSTIQNITKVIDPIYISEILNKKILYKDLHIKFVRVYLKNCDDFINVKKVMDQKFPNVAISYLIADICRSELLIEIEVYAEIEKKYT